MRFGVCAPFQHLDLLTQAGYDYFEPALAPTLRPEDAEDAVMPPLHTALQGACLVPETWNVLLPGDLKVVGELVEVERQQQYLDAGFARVASLGGQIVVFGSGVARGVPEGFSPQVAQTQLQEFLHRASAAAIRHQLLVAIEPLHTGECNIINSVAEATLLAQAVNSPAIRVLSDLYHVTQEQQSYEETVAAGPRLAHVHVAGLLDRRAPIREDEDFLRGYFRALKSIGYDERVSVEGQWQDIAAQAAETLAVLRDAWAAA